MTTATAFFLAVIVTGVPWSGPRDGIEALAFSCQLEEQYYQFRQETCDTEFAIAERYLDDGSYADPVTLYRAGYDYYFEQANTWEKIVDFPVWDVAIRNLSNRDTAQFLRLNIPLPAKTFEQISWVAVTAEFVREFLLILGDMRDEGVLPDEARFQA